MNSKTFDNVQMNQNERRYFNRRNDFLKNLEQTEEISVTDQRKFDSFFTVKKDIKKLQERSASAKTGAGGRTTPTPQTNTAGMGPEGMETLRDEARKRAVTPQRMPKQMDAPPVVDQPPTLFPIGTRTDFWEENPAVEYDLTGKPKNYSFAQIESFPTSILAISQMSEDFGPFGLPQAQLDKIKFVTSISGFDHSVLKKNYFYLDETIDVEFYRDLSPYSRKVFKNSR